MSEYIENPYISIRDSLKSINKFGIVSEKDYPYTKINLTKKPDENTYKNAHKIKLEYIRVPININFIKNILCEKKMIVCNFSIYSSFLDTSVRNTGRISMPEYYDKFVGMLSAVIVGYIFDKDLIIIKMCFGDLWGDHGVFTTMWIFGKPIYIQQVERAQIGIREVKINH